MAFFQVQLCSQIWHREMTKGSNRPAMSKETIQAMDKARFAEW